MRSLLIVVLVLAVAVSASARSLEGSFVELVSPASVSPGATYTFVFDVWNNSVDTEWIMNVLITFPEASMAFDEISAGRPSFDMYVPDGPTAIWADNDGGYGEIWDGEVCRLYVEATVATQLYGIPVFWCLQGDIWGDPPHEVCDCIDLQTTPVEDATWSAIKSLYR